MTTQPAVDFVGHIREAAALAGLELPEVVAPTRQQTILNGMRLHYLDWGGTDSAPILFLHGGGLTAHTWDLVCLALRDSFHPIALDLRGHGDSEWSPDARYGLSDFADDVAALVEHLQWKRFVLVGMSLGGLTALAYAGRYPDRLSGLVLVDVGPQMTGAGRRAIRDFANLESELDSVEAFVERAQRFNARRRPELLRRSLLHKLRQTPHGTWTWKYDRRRYTSPQIAERQAQEQQALWDVVPRITCPTLVVRGTQSDVFLEQDAHALVAALPGGQHAEIQGAGHTVQGDQPARLVAALRGFLGDEVGIRLTA